MGDVVAVRFGKPIETVLPEVLSEVVTLEQWRIGHTDVGTSHLIGVAEGNVGRVSSDIVQVDFASMTATTVSGRVYLLKGPTGKSSISERVWALSLQRHNISEDTDQ